MGAVPGQSPLPAGMLYRLLRPIRLACPAAPAMFTPETTKSFVQLGGALMSKTYLAGWPIVPPLPLLSE